MRNFAKFYFVLYKHSREINFFAKLNFEKGSETNANFR